MIMFADSTDSWRYTALGFTFYNFKLQLEMLTSNKYSKRILESYLFIYPVIL